MLKELDLIILTDLHHYLASLNTKKWGFCFKTPNVDFLENDPNDFD
jgi:hypothetical protein